MRALDLALELARMPTLAAGMRSQPLPPGVIDVIRIAGGCAESTRTAGRVTGARTDTIRAAAVLYLQTILFAPDSDCYRTLGVAPDATKPVMREHMRWLMHWLHPDHAPDDWDSVFAARVLAAWREAGDGLKPPRSAERVASRNVFGRALKHRGRLPRATQRWVALPLPGSAALMRRRNRLFAAVAALGCVALLILLAPMLPRTSDWLGLFYAEAGTAGSSPPSGGPM